jgi:hypothetical protein
MNSSLSFSFEVPQHACKYPFGTPESSVHSSMTRPGNALLGPASEGSGRIIGNQKLEQPISPLREVKGEHIDRRGALPRMRFWATTVHDT